MRPKSIVLFERLYLASFAAGLLSAWQNWGVRAAMLKASGVAGHWLGAGSTIAGAVVAMVLLFLVARRASITARWIVVLFAIWGAGVLLFLLLGLLRGTGVPAFLLVGVAQNLLYIAATTMLFQPDAREWFGEHPRAAGLQP